MVNLHGLGVDVGFERVGGVRQCRKFVSHQVISFDTAATRKIDR
jgi:hypothetical protein